MKRTRSGVVSATTVVVVAVSGLLVLAGGAGFFGLSRAGEDGARAAEPPKTTTDKQAQDPSEKRESHGGDSRYVLGCTVKDIDGKDVDLSTYKGKVVVLVNVASKCGFTSQYEGLEKLYKDKKDKGLVILGFPANNFNGQEPGSDSEIKEFCTSKFGVSFPMFSKISVKGQDVHPLYAKLAAQPEPIGGAPKWNFTKFVVDRNGDVVARYDAARENVRKPDLEKDLLTKIDALLEAK